MVIASAVTPPSGAKWKVTGISQVTRPGTTGRFIPGFTIQFTVTGVGTGSVFLPETIATVETVRKMVTQKAATLRQIGTLTG